MMNGRPLLSWTIETAIGSAAFDAVVVSTDDDEIAQVAADSGGQVSFRRPDHLSDDHASTTAVLAHAVAELLDQGVLAGDDDLVCCLYPAAIGLRGEDLRRGRALLESSDVPYVTTVLRYSHPIQRAMEIEASGRIRMLDAQAGDRRTQDLPPRWHDAGQCYWGRRWAWARALPIFPNSLALELPASEVLDIDTEDDWVRAERLHALSRASRPHS